MKGSVMVVMMMLPTVAMALLITKRVSSTVKVVVSTEGATNSVAITMKQRKLKAKLCQVTRLRRFGAQGRVDSVDGSQLLA